MLRTWQSLILAVAVTLAALPVRAGEPLVASDVRVGQHAKNTRFVLSLSTRADVEVFTLADPYRIVVDFPEVAWQVDPAATQSSVGLIKGFRYGLFRPGRSRMVIDLSGPATIASKFLLPPDAGHSYRLVLDLAPSDRTKYLATAGWPEATPGEAPEPLEPAVDMPAKPKNAKRVIVIDAGHGGVDPGATGVDGTYEKDLVLSVAQTLRDTLADKYTVVMTRDRDIFLSLRARVAVSRQTRADLFISLHADSAPGSYVRGASVYTLSERASDREAEALARSENQSDIIAGVDLTNEADVVTSILIDLAQRETKNSSVKFAQLLVPELQTAGQITHKSHKFAGFVVLKAPDVPSVLIELGYLSSRQDESLMNSGRWRKRVAHSISRAVDGYFRQRRSDQKVEAYP